MQGYAIPGFEDAVWEYSSGSRKLRRLSAAGLSDSFGVSKTGAAADGGANAGSTTYASTWDPDSVFGFSAKIQDYTYRLLRRAADACIRRGRDFPAQPAPERRRALGMSGELGNASPLCDRSDSEASLSSGR